MHSKLQILKCFIAKLFYRQFQLRWLVKFNAANKITLTHNIKWILLRLYLYEWRENKLKLHSFQILNHYISRTGCSKFEMSSYKNKDEIDKRFSFTLNGSTIKNIMH